MYYLDVQSPMQQFKIDRNSKIFVDKTMLIDKVNEVMNTNQRFICITRPRRFGKTMNANMLAAYYTLGYESHELFTGLSITKTEHYEKHLNKHHVIYINFSRMPFQCTSYNEYITNIYHKLCKDILNAYKLNDDFVSLEDLLKATNDSFIFIFDEWDSIFQRQFMTNENKQEFLDFLNDLLKDQPYVELAYMTGVLPITKYSSGSALNVFKEYSFINDHIYDTFFGFSEEEVHKLCDENKTISYDEMKYWYDGYKLQNGQSLFNPRSVSSALTDGVCLNYWTETGPMNEIADCIGNNVDKVRDDIVKLVSEIPIYENLKGYSASDLELNNKDEIFSAMVVYGFLSYHDGKLRIPNHELMMKFENVLEKENMGDVAEIVENSGNMLKATIRKESDTVAQYLREVHAREVPLLKYNDENSLSCVITLCYLKARDYYHITREEHSGESYADFIFHPLAEGYPAIVLELKCGHNAEEAIHQIKTKKYIDNLRKEKKILLVGINYDRDTKDHTCIIEEYRESEV